MSAEKKLAENVSDALPLSEKWKEVETLSVSRDSSETFSEKSIGVAEHMDSNEAIILANKNKLHHLVNSTKFDYQRELNVAAMMIHQSKNLFNHPASSVFSPEDTNDANEDKFKFVEYEFSKASEKFNALILLEVELEKISSNESLITNVRTIADELFTNAVYNAPGHNESPLDGKATMNNGKSGTIFLAKDEKMLLIGCIDPYGSLKPDALVSRIHKCYEDGVANTMNMSKSGGAGIGAFMAYDLCTSFYVAVKPGEMTVVMCAIPLHLSNRKIQKMPKNFHLLLADEQ